MSFSPFSSSAISFSSFTSSIISFPSFTSSVIFLSFLADPLLGLPLPFLTGTSSSTQKFCDLGKLQLINGKVYLRLFPRHRWLRLCLLLFLQWSPQQHLPLLLTFPHFLHLKSRISVLFLTINPIKWEKYLQQRQFPWPSLPLHFYHPCCQLYWPLSWPHWLSQSLQCQFSLAWLLFWPPILSGTRLLWLFSFSLLLLEKNYQVFFIATNGEKFT